MATALQSTTPAPAAPAPAYWWHVRMRVEPAAPTLTQLAAGVAVLHVEKVCAHDPRQATALAKRAAAEKWRGCTIAVLDLVQEGL